VSLPCLRAIYLLTTGTLPRAAAPPSNRTAHAFLLTTAKRAMARISKHTAARDTLPGDNASCQHRLRYAPPPAVLHSFLRIRIAPQPSKPRTDVAQPQWYW